MIRMDEGCGLLRAVAGAGPENERPKRPEWVTKEFPSISISLTG